MFKYLSPRALEGLKNYQYKPAGYTMLDDLHQPFWNYCVKLLPMWLAPNLVTLSGLFCLMAAYIANAYYLPDFVGEAPRWVYALSGIAVLLYVHLDCLDGKQARRTGSSSPLGQLFDHGCDALSVHLLLTCMACSFSISCSSWTTVVGVLGVKLPWVLAQWEEYHTGIMLYGNDYYGVLEANYSIALIHFITMLTGPGVWLASVSQYLPFQLGFEILTRDVLICVLVATGFIQVHGQLTRVLNSDPTKMPPKERGNKQLGRFAAIVHLLSLGVLLVLGAVWLLDGDHVPGQCRAVKGSFGVVYALAASQLIIAHMAKEPFEPALWAISCLAIGAVNSRLRLVDPYYASVFLVAVTVGGYLHWVTSVIAEICAFLNIRCLSIKRST